MDSGQVLLKNEIKIIIVQKTNRCDVLSARAQLFKKMRLS